MRPATLDRVENGGSGSDTNRRERKSKGTKLDKPSTLPARDLQSAAVLEAVKARPGNVGVCFYGGATAGLDSLCARRRPKSTVRAEESLRRGRTKERRRNKKARKKALAFVAAIRERRNGFSDRTKKRDEKTCVALPNRLDKRSTIQGSPPGFDIAYPNYSENNAVESMMGIGSVLKYQFMAPGERPRSWQLIRFRHFRSGSLALASLNRT